MPGVEVHQRGRAALGVLLSFVGYGILARFVEREQFGVLLGLYGLLFAAFYALYQSKFTFRQLLVLALLFRLLFLLVEPALSNDFFRFVWDGRMLAAGFNPYLYLPVDFVQTHPAVIAEGELLVQGMGALNAGHYTVYPPLNQLGFWLSGWLFPKDLSGAVVTMRLLIVLADLGVVYIGARLLGLLKRPKRAIFLYALNPFVLLEFTGNLHWEGVMVFFLLLALYTLVKQKWLTSAIFWGLSISVKLIPLLFLPLLIPRLGWKKTIVFGSISLGILVLLFLPFLSEALIVNFGSSLELYFQNFEFNASIYYLLREAGYRLYGYNIISTLGKILPALVFLSVILLSWFTRKASIEKLPQLMLWAICIYYLLSTTIHPWYLGVPLMLSVFTRYRFMQAWSFLVILSYSAYGQAAYQERLWLVSLEYLGVLVFFLVEHFHWLKRPIPKENIRA